jgi:hypothetical protein
MEKAMPTDKSLPENEHAHDDSTLLPMLIGGLVLIIIGAIVVMTFV